MKEGDANPFHNTLQSYLYTRREGKKEIELKRSQSILTQVPNNREWVCVRAGGGRTSANPCHTATNNWYTHKPPIHVWIPNHPHTESNNTINQIKKINSIDWLQYLQKPSPSLLPSIHETQKWIEVEQGKEYRIL